MRDGAGYRELGVGSWELVIVEELGRMIECRMIIFFLGCFETMKNKDEKGSQSSLS